MRFVLSFVFHNCYRKQTKNWIYLLFFGVFFNSISHTQHTHTQSQCDGVACQIRKIHKTKSMRSQFLWFQLKIYPWINCSHTKWFWAHKMLLRKHNNSNNFDVTCIRLTIREKKCFFFHISFQTSKTKINLKFTKKLDQTPLGEKKSLDD